ncbi:hydroxyacid dehydrogenase [Microbacterium esteraromaticum]|uniref:hydroxyacid dehydrogenase n=1 Tax=Microbacterium esteraromaticum TaxID=57043 RepID=UPI0019D40755|nr:hydroxyacid dehydrogenase [Microbacterium esteraromaticum]MBN7793699.1 hydroxyacid dehydrogenase [Microbacterium esteraromaticum]
MNRPPRVAFAMDQAAHAAAFLPDTLERLARIATVVDPAPLGDLRSDGARAALAQTDVLITGWGAPSFDLTTLDDAPALRAIVHAAGTVRLFLDPLVLERGIRVSSCASANAVPVAEFAFACTILGLKRTNRFVAQLHATKGTRDTRRMPPIGAYGVTVGVVGASRVGREMLRMLRSIDAHVLLSDPYISAEEAQALGAELVGLDELCRRSAVISIHAPLTDTTAGMIGARELALMRDGAVLINTARGGLIDTAALTREAVAGRIDAYLDVVAPEPLPADSPLYTLPNVTITPHIAGALGNEVSRLGELAVAEVARFAADDRFDHEVRPADFAIMA